jgi:hypothetical protein
MRHAFLGSLIVAALTVSSAAFAVEAGSDPAAGNAPPAPSSKQIKSAKPKRTTVPLSAYDTRSTELPLTPIHPSQPPPTERPWTGIYIGAGAGAGLGN